MFHKQLFSEKKKVVNDSVFQVVILKCLSMYVHSSISKFSEIPNSKGHNLFGILKSKAYYIWSHLNLADSPMQSKIHANVMAS